VKFIKATKKSFLNTLPLTIPMLLPLMVYLFSDYIGNHAIIYYGIGIIFAYFVSLFTVIFKLEGGNIYWGDSTNDMFSIMIFLGWSILIIIMFGIGWHGFYPDAHNFTLAATVPGVYDGNYKIEYLDSFYFSTVTFTSVGYGDFIPRNYFGKLLSCEEAFIGHVHTVVFFSIIIAKVSGLKGNTSLTKS